MSWEQIVVRFGVALLFGGLIGLERQWRSHYVGLRTNTLLTLGATALMVFGRMITGDNPAYLEHIASQVITGVGLLCAGVIMREGVNARGFNTAATLWCSVTVGLFCGMDFFLPAAILTICIILVNLLLGPVVYFINKTTVLRDPEFPPPNNGQ